MKSLLIILFALGTYSVLGQNEATSFYFGTPQPKQVPTILQFDTTICGKYFLENDSLVRLVITPDSIYLEQSVLFVLTKKDLKNAKGSYYTEGNKLFGIVVDEGIPFVMENDTTYAIYHQSTSYFKPSTSSILKKQNKTYFLNEKLENSYYSSTILYSFGKGIAVYSIDHEEVMAELQEFNQLDSIYINDFKTYIAEPTLPEMNTFIQKKGFRDGILFFEPQHFIRKD